MQSGARLAGGEEGASQQPEEQLGFSRRWKTAAGPPAPSLGGRRGSDLFPEQRRLPAWLSQGCGPRNRDSILPNRERGDSEGLGRDWVASTPRQTGAQSDQDLPSQVRWAALRSLPHPRTLPARGAPRTGQQLGPRREARLSWEGGEARPRARGKHPQRGVWAELKSKKRRGYREAADKAEATACPGRSQAPGPATFCPSWPSQRSLRSTGGHTAVSPLCAQIWCSARPEHPVSAALPDLEPARLSPEPAGPCPHRGSRTSSPGAAEPALLPRLPASRRPLDSPIPAIRQPSPKSPTSSSPRLEFDSSSPRSRICTKAATPNLDLHTPLRFVF